MRINFRQGIVGHQAGGFLSVNPGTGNVDILALNRPVTLSVAHRNTNYTHSENDTVTSAWLGPFLPTVNYWLFWDFNLLTFQRTFGVTTLEPVAQSAEPGNGNAPIVGVIPGLSPGVGAFIVPEFYALPVGRLFSVIGSAGNDGNYTVTSTSFNQFTGQTTIFVSENVNAVSGSPLLGELTLDLDSFSQPLLQDGRHWFDTVTNRHFVRQGGDWVEVLRVFAAQLKGGNTFIPQTIKGGSFIGTQIGNTNSVRSGRVLFDEASDPIRRDDRTFFTTEDQFFASAARVDAIRLESNVARAQFPNDPAIAQFSVVAWVGDGKAQTAQYEDIGTTVVGVLTENVLINEVGAVIIQGVVTNFDWDWLSETTVGAPLWVDNGELVSVDPHTVDVIAHPKRQVPVARVLDTNTVVFEQGLGGVGPAGPPGSFENLPPATDSVPLGAVLLSLAPVDPDLPIAVGDNDPRMTNTRDPNPHNQAATTITFTPGGGLTSNNAQDALVELGSGKVNRSGDTMTGFLTLNANPVNPLHAAPKQYVDGLVSGLIWLDPICLVNLISDATNIPPVSPQFSDAYILNAGGTGAWTGFLTGDIAQWDGTTWNNLGPVTGFDPRRFGVSMTSSTTAGGSFLGRDNEIAIFNASGVLTGFETPINNNAVFVCSDSSLHAFNQYAFDDTPGTWVQFGGGGAVTPDNTTTILTGNILSVKQASAGGTVDAATLGGFSKTALDSIYAPIVHNQAATTITVTPYTSSPDWGTPVPSTIVQLNSTNAQAALQELVDEKASKTPEYATFGDLPTPSNVVGMVAYVSTGPETGLYFAKTSGWVLLAANDGTVQDHDHELPYDITFFVSGPAASTTNKTVAIYVATRDITVEANALNLEGFALTAPSTGDVTFNLVKNGNTGSPVGEVTFENGSNTLATSGGSPNVVTATTTGFTLSAGDRLQLVTPAISEANIADVSISIIGCSTIGNCPT